MSLGTIAFEGEVYNLDYMTSEELETLLEHVEKEKLKTKKEIKKIVN